RFKPGKMMIVDMEEHRILFDEEIKESLANAAPYRDWLARYRVKLDAITSGRKATDKVEGFERLLHTFMYDSEEIEKILTPMTVEGKEPIHSMGDDSPLAALSKRRQPLYNYFRQHFAQVTNPPIDPLREELVMNLDSYIGSVNKDMFDFSPEQCKMVLLKRPIITNRELDLLCHLRYKGFDAVHLDMTFPVEEGTEGLEKGIERLCREAEKAVDEGCSYLVLTDRGVSSDRAPIPSLLATAALHHHLIDARKRTRTAIVVETGDAREVMHFALLVGYGASAINPYMALAVIEKMVADRKIQLDFDTASRHYIEAVDKGLLKIMSKMGISTLTSYKGAQLFEALGLSDRICERYFGGTPSKISGLGLKTITDDILEAHREAWSGDFDENAPLPYAGRYSFKKAGETHAWNPEAVKALRKATRLDSYKQFEEFCDIVDNHHDPIFIRDFLEVGGLGEGVPLEEVESEEAIIKRFFTGAISFGAISIEAHEAIAAAMNSIGARSNTGEGGEDSARFTPREDGSSVRSAIKQVASGRFGVTTNYLVNADEIQIKVAQGAKPGEGGQLPGFKVDRIIAKTRHSIPGISLISPPPHHDIYSIEDLAQLVFDLKNVNPRAKVSVKLVSESGVGTIAAGVAKAKSDIINISGSDGGTGASPASSIRYAGTPVELGLSETQQTLVLNGLRGQVRLQADGQLKSAKDVLVMAMLGAEDYGFSTAAMIVLGCIMDRRCHNNKCPVGIATQNPELRAKYDGPSEYLVRYFRFLARRIREMMAERGIRRLDEIIGRPDLLRVKQGLPEGIDLSRLLHIPEEAVTNNVICVSVQKHEIDGVLDRRIIAMSYPAIHSATPVEMEFPVNNTDRSVGAMLSGEVALKYGDEGLPNHDVIKVIFKGSSGQSFGAFLTKGITFRLEGDANDYVGKGLSGGRIVIVPPAGSEFAPENSIIAGNTILYGATSGEVFINGRVGERFCVRNSGATAVVEGVGDHCCEYMTGGVTVVLGPTGRNFAAGMSGGVAYVYDPERTFDYFCNMEMVELSLVDDPGDVRELHRLVSAHYRHTRSPLAARLLDDWDNAVKDFIQVIPTEYKRLKKKD
ncbi:MAG: glutamate synthase large subunit, partial [Muribaculaceae bacterium]|nr:glutamate synthase large subunit [Muribaculaceae bacterium]